MALSEEEDLNWIKWFCSMQGNEFFCEVDRAFIEDSFNLFGIKQMFPHDYNLCLALILDKTDMDDDEDIQQDQQQAAEVLYGIIHARYLLSAQGLIGMHRKFQSKTFGECPRTCCNGQAVLPVGLSDDIGMTPVKLFCPKCRDVYNTPSNRHLDGAFFGTTFAHMFLLTFETLIPPAPSHHYVPRAFGFKIHASSIVNPSVRESLGGGINSSSNNSFPSSQLQQHTSNNNSSNHAASTLAVAASRAIAAAGNSAVSSHVGGAAGWSQHSSSWQQQQQGSYIFSLPQAAEERYQQQQQQQQQQGSKSTSHEDNDDNDQTRGITVPQIIGHNRHSISNSRIPGGLPLDDSVAVEEEDDIEVGMTTDKTKDVVVNEVAEEEEDAEANGEWFVASDDEEEEEEAEGNEIVLDKKEAAKSKKHTLSVSPQHRPPSSKKARKH